MERFDRYPPIGWYSMIGDCRSAALVSKTGSIDWMCLPRFDSQWIFGRLLDWDHGGYFEIVPQAKADCDRTYRTNSNAMETRWWYDHRRMRVVDFMPHPANDGRGRPPQSLRVVRLIIGVAGQVEWKAVFRPRMDYGRKRPAIRKLPWGCLEVSLGEDRLFLQYPDLAEVEIREGEAEIRGVARPGRRRCFVLHYVQGQRTPARVPYETADRWLHETDDYWTKWLQASGYHGRYLEQIRRSALALKLLQYEPTGTFVAAPTTSLPESLGGSLNWDYRYTWLRDTAILVHALSELGQVEEAAAYIQWLNRIHQRHPKHFQIMYTIDGQERIPEQELDHLPGYCDSRPVRIGNAAVEQLQLDVYGEVMETAYVAWEARERMPQANRRTLLAIVDYILDHWRDEDAGMWEARSQKRRYLYSQIMCWVGLRCALRMNRSLRMGGRRTAAAKKVMDDIRHDILEHGYNHQIGAFTQALDHAELDATALNVILYRLLPPDDPRVTSTVEVLWRRLSRDGLLYRYEADRSEFKQEEGTFLICTAWMVRSLAMMGRKEEAEQLFARLTETCNDVGLYSEEFDPGRDTMLGNFPQALSHLAVIRAALELEGRGHVLGGPDKRQNNLATGD
jgi:GH15 family glucan-1,4-alpha-glucosidase